MKYVIRSDSERGFWLNTIGWVSCIVDATIFNEEEIKDDAFLFPLCRGNDAEWVVYDYGE
jgi:hypothetical protein